MKMTSSNWQQVIEILKIVFSKRQGTSLNFILYFLCTIFIVELGMVGFKEEFYQIYQELSAQQEINPWQKALIQTIPLVLDASWWKIGGTFLLILIIAGLIYQQQKPKNESQTLNVQSNNIINNILTIKDINNVVFNINLNNINEIEQFLDSHKGIINELKPEVANILKQKINVKNNNPKIKMEDLKKQLNELIDEREFGKFFIQIKNSSFDYNKELFGKLKEEYGDGENSTQFVRRLRLLVDSIK